jgi:lupus La protein
MAEVTDSVADADNNVEQKNSTESEIPEGTTEAATTEVKPEETKTDEAADSVPTDNKRKENDSADRPNQNKRARYNSNIVSRFDDQPESNDSDEIRRQVEFYFSDSNLPIDRFLLDLTGGFRNNPVDLKVIHNFKRMRHFQPYSAVRDAVKQSQYLDINDQDEITRKVPLDEKYGNDLRENKQLLMDKSMCVHAGIRFLLRFFFSHAILLT